MDEILKVNEARINSLRQLRSNLDSSQPLPGFCDLELLYEEREVWKLTAQFVRSFLHHGNAFEIGMAVTPVLDALNGRSAVLRQMIDIVSSTTLRPLTIMDMPDEILIKIFEQTEDWVKVKGDSFARRNAVDIKNIRLTCRRFHDASSHLLISRVRVELTEESLYRLEEISCHPVISKGIRGVHVALDFYDSIFASSIRTLTLANIRRLFRMLDDEKNRIKQPDDKPNKTANLIGINKDQVIESLQRGREILDIMMHCLSRYRTVDNSEEMTGCCAMLSRAHDTYQQRDKSQKNLIHSGKFTKAVTAAVTRMPCIRELHFFDGEDERYFPRRYENFHAITHDPEALYRLMISPSQWEGPTPFQTGHPPVELLVEIPAAIGEAGIKIAGIYFNLAVPRDASKMIPSVQESQNISCLVQRLRTFHFTPTYREKIRFTISSNMAYGMAEGILAFIAPFIDGIATLEALYVDFLGLWNGRHNPPPCSLGRLLQGNCWPNLKYLQARGMTVQLAELKAFSDSRLRLTGYYFYKVHLLTGSWAEALEVLRRTSGPLSGLKYPSGGECKEMTHEDVSWIFGESGMESTKYGPLSQASLYISKLKSINPFLKGPPPEDAVDVEMLDVA